VNLPLSEFVELMHSPEHDETARPLDLISIRIFSRVSGEIRDKSVELFGFNKIRSSFGEGLQTGCTG
jgi:hypothetical protein